MDHTTSSGLARALGVLARNRDPAAWTMLVEQAGPEMARLARRLTGEAALGDDAVQEALLQIRDGAGRFTAITADADADAWRWIMRVTSNAALQLLRRQRRGTARDRRGGDPGAEPEGPGMALERAEQATLIRRELAELPEPTQAAIVLHCVEGLGYEQVASALRMPVGTAKTRVHRGLEALRQRLGRVGCTLSLAVLVGSLQQLPAATTPVTAAAWLPVLTSAKTSTVAGISATTISASILGASMSVKIALGLAAALAIATVPVLLSQDGPTTVPTAPRTTTTTGQPAELVVPVVPVPIPIAQTAGKQPSPELSRRLEQTVTFAWENNLPVSKAVFQLRQLTGVDIILDPKVIAHGDPNLTLTKVKDMKLKDVLSFAFEELGLVVLDGDVVLITEREPVARAWNEARIDRPSAALLKRLEGSRSCEFLVEKFLVDEVKSMREHWGIDVVIDPAVMMHGEPKFSPLKIGEMPMRDFYRELFEVKLGLKVVLSGDVIYLTTKGPVTPQAANPAKVVRPPAKVVRPAPAPQPPVAAPELAPTAPVNPF